MNPSDWIVELSKDEIDFESVRSRIHDFDVEKTYPDKMWAPPIMVVGDCNPIPSFRPPSVNSGIGIIGRKCGSPSLPSNVAIDRLVDEVYMDNSNRTIIVSGGSGLSRSLFDAMISRSAEMLHDHYPDEAVPCSENIFESSKCETDHGERTNYKLKDQPFYMRSRNGKMRKF